MTDMEQDGWYREAAMYARNADYWRDRALRAERFTLGRLWQAIQRRIRRDKLS